MLTEVTDLSPTSISLESCDAPAEAFSPLHPFGLAAIKDSIQPCQAAPKPNRLKRLILSLTLFLVHLSTWTVQLFTWALSHLLGQAGRQKSLYSQLYHIAKTGNQQEIQHFLKNHRCDPSAAGFLFGEFLHLSEAHLYLPEILKGANVCLCEDRGFFFDRWKEHAHAYPRLSSHDYQKGQCYAVGHLLFWLSPTGNTHFQFEKSPSLGFVDAIHHLVDYLRYWRDNEQQGVMGASPYTEKYCLNVRISPVDFLARHL